MKASQAVFNLDSGECILPVSIVPLNILRKDTGMSLVAQWLRIRLPMQGTRV